MTKPLEEFLADALLQRNATLAAAESCTGGLLSDRITNVPGASTFFLGGVVAYSNAAKLNLLHVSPHTLDTFGAVSPQVVLEMAAGARTIFQADIALSVSGIAGPGGSTLEKPVGTTWLALATPQGSWTRHFLWHGNRLQNKQRSAQAALQFILDFLAGTL